MRARSAFIFPSAVALVGIWGLVETLGWPIKAWLYPRVVLIPLIALAVAEAALAWRGAPEVSRQGQAATDIEFEATVPPEVARRRTWRIAAWILGFFLSVVLIGFQATVPLFVLAYLRVHRESWGLAAVLAASATAAFHGLFVSLLHLPLPPGVLLGALLR